jgi:hypothetical protein
MVLVLVIRLDAAYERRKAQREKLQYWKWQRW